MSILERLEQLERRLADVAAARPPQGGGAPPQTPPGQVPGATFEARLVAVCEALMARGAGGGSGTSSTGGGASSWGGATGLAHGAPPRGLTLLHLAAAQGYARLLHTLRRWRALAADSLALEQEIDPLNVDHCSCTPLMWACALGHGAAAEGLWRWEARALLVPDSRGRLPLGLALARGHRALVARLRHLQNGGGTPGDSPWDLVSPPLSPLSPPGSPPPPLPPPPGPEALRSPLSASPDTGLSTASSLSPPPELSEPPGSLPPPPPSPPEADDSPQPSDALQPEVVTLARQILEATPERIKQGGGHEAGGAPGGLSAAMAWLATYLDSVDRPPPQRQEAPPPAPFPRWGGPERFPPPIPSSSAAGWAEFLGASARLESDFALLTLSDHEQHELYEAARLIQSAFRRARGRRLKEQQEVAAAVIQRCYRKYKQFALFQRMTRAAILIQSKFRSYQEQKRFQRRRRAALLIQQRFRSHRQGLQGPPRAPPAPAPRTKAPFLTKKQDQAARKIMRFLRRCRHRMKELKQSRELESLQKRGLAS